MTPEMVDRLLSIAVGARGIHRATETNTRGARSGGSSAADVRHPPSCLKDADVT